MAITFMIPMATGKAIRAQRQANQDGPVVETRPQVTRAPVVGAERERQQVRYRPFTGGELVGAAGSEDGMSLTETSREVDPLARECELSDETRSASRLLDRDGITLNSMSAGRTCCRNVGRSKKPISAA
jgi:hypothetical protein